VTQISRLSGLTNRKWKNFLASSRLEDIIGGHKQILTIAGAIFISYVLLHIALGRHQLPAYDAYTYMGFAKHYAENWFQTIIPSQAHGLQIASYPPLLFQVMALLSFIPFLKMTHIYILLTSAGVTGLSLSLYYLLNELFNIDGKINQIVVLFIAFSPGLMKSTFIYGQMTSIFGMTSGFAAVTLYYKFIKGQENLGAPLIISLVLTGYIHHFSLLVTSLILVIISLVNISDVVSRIGYLSVIGLISGFLIILGLSTTIKEILFSFSQGTIPHSSRHPLQSTRIFNQMVASTYGISIAGVWLLIKNKFGPLSAKLTASIFLVIGLGFVTPLPKILFGDFANILVYTRFSLIASLFLSGLIGVYVTEKLSPKRFLKRIDLKHVLLAIFVLLSMVTLLWANNIHLGSYTGSYETSISAQTSTAIQYLNTEASTDYLYVTYGHLQPVDEIRMQTDIPTLDTGYYPGRNIEDFKTFGKLDRLPQHKFSEVVENADNLSLKYILSFDKELDSLMNNSEWRRKNLDDRVDVWINKEVPKYKPNKGEKHFLFGTIPILTLLISAGILHSKKTRRKSEELIRLAQAKIESLSKGFNDKKINIAVVLLLVLLAAAPSLLTKGLPAGIDTPSYLFRVEVMSSMLKEYGKVFNWTNMWYNGYPFLSMYSPITSHLIHSLETFTGELTLSYNLIRLSALGLLAGIVYRLSRNISEDRRVSILAATLVIFSYPLYSNLYTVGRISSGLALPLYLLLIDFLLRDDMFTKKVTRSNIYLGLGATILFLTHSMMAYLFVFTGLIFTFIYRNQVKNIGIKPLLTTSAIPIVLCFPYLSKLIQHMGIIETSWYVFTRPFSIQEQLKLSFNTIPPTYLGAIHAALLIYGLVNYFKSKNRFLKFSVLNFSFFYLLFWARNFKVAGLIMPFARQFDLAEFEILFAVFGVLIAAYGFKKLLKEHLSGINGASKNLLTIAVIIITIVNTSPMLTQSANWAPEFSGEINKAPIEDEYRAIGTGMKVWDSYLLYKSGIPNTFGWFNQANPNKRFTQALQEAGGRWYGNNLSSSKYNSTLRKNLMEVSNTKYIIAATGEWVKPSVKQQVVGARNISHSLDEDLIEEISRDEEFNKIYASEHLEVSELERNMSYCQKINPVWIQDDYREKAIEFFQTSTDVLPKFPVEGNPRNMENGKIEVSCHKENPYTISIDADGTGWILVKESYYPFWERSDEGKIINGYGFQVIHIDGEKNLELEYQPRNISTLSLDDIKSFTRTIFN
jgi:hypothetical protein